MKRRGEPYVECAVSMIDLNIVVIIIIIVPGIIIIKMKSICFVSVSFSTEIWYNCKKFLIRFSFEYCKTCRGNVCGIGWFSVWIVQKKYIGSYIWGCDGRHIVDWTGLSCSSLSLIVIVAQFTRFFKIIFNPRWHRFFNIAICTKCFTEFFPKNKCFFLK